VIVARGGGSLADLFAFCDEALCRTVALLRVPVIASVGHHTDRTLIDDVAAVSCSTPTHAAEAAVPVDCRAARADVAACARRLNGHGRRAVLERARTLTHYARTPGQHVAKHRLRLHQLVREMRASSARSCENGRSLASVHTLVLSRTAERAKTSEQARRRSELGRLALALAAHDPERTLARGYAMVEDRDGTPLTSAAAAREAGELGLHFHDGTVRARVDEQ
jgi:exodeoxyribonuclease VII large subunit